MKFLHTFLLLTCSFSHLSLAQQILNGDISNSIDPINRQINKLTLPTVPKLKDKPFSINEFSNIAETVTLPLSALAPALEIRALDGSVIFKDVEVENGWRAIERQWMVLADDDTLSALTHIGAEIVATKSLGPLGLTLLHFIAPLNMDSRAALEKILPTSSAKTLDRNHVFSAQSDNSSESKQSPLASLSAPACFEKVSIGMVDSNIETSHQAFLRSTIVTKNIVSKQIVSPVRHGTAVASLLVGEGDSLHPLLPNGDLYLASVFHRQSDFAQGATTVNIIEGLNWLVAKQVEVINMSLAGPDNQLLALVIEKLAQRNIIVVAAAGNEGPLAPPLFPAAYEHVIAVSATDHQQRIYRWSNRGEHIDFAALGVNVTTAQPGNGFGLESGTSMASPVIAAIIACQSKTSSFTPISIKQKLRNKAIDLGATGKDPVFGYGLITPN